MGGGLGRLSRGCCVNVAHVCMCSAPVCIAVTVCSFEFGIILTEHHIGSTLSRLHSVSTRSNQCSTTDSCVHSDDAIHLKGTHAARASDDTRQSLPDDPACARARDHERHGEHFLDGQQYDRRVSCVGKPRRLVRARTRSPACVV